MKEHYGPARNHTTLHDHALLVTYSTVLSQFEHVRKCKNLQKIARICKIMQEAAKLCKKLQETAKTCKNLQETARICVSVSQLALGVALPRFSH